MGQHLVIVSSPLSGCVSFTPFRLSAVASALSLPGSWLFFLLWICRFTVRSSAAVPRGNFWGSRGGWVFQFSTWFEFCLTFSLSFPGCSHPGLVVAPSPGFDFAGLVASGSSELEAAQPVRSVLSLRRSLAFVWCGLQSPPPLIPRILRRALPYGLTVSPLPHYCWSRIHGQASAGLIC